MIASHYYFQDESKKTPQKTVLQNPFIVIALEWRLATQDYGYRYLAARVLIFFSFFKKNLNCGILHTLECLEEVIQSGIIS